MRKTEIAMKHVLRNLAMFMMVVACGIITSCSNEDGDAGGAGDKSAVVNGKVSKLNYGFWETHDGEVSLYFSNVDILNMSSLPKKVEMLTMNIEGRATSIQTGTHRAYIEYDSLNPASETYFNFCAYGNVDVTIAKNGSEYTITIPETTVRYYEGEDEYNYKTVPFTFSYTGRLVYAHFDE